MNRKSKADGRRKGCDGDEVDLMLRAAEDELLLNLSVDSHMSRGVSQSSYIDPDLDRRFQALRSSSSRPTTHKAARPPPPKPQPPPPTETTADHHDEDEKAKDKKRVVFDSSSKNSGDDLFARFAALKSSLPSSSSDSLDPQRPNKSNGGDEKLNRPTIASDDGVDEDEVQKLIQWAIDAARLDPSPPTDSDADDENNSNDDDDSDDDIDFNDHKKKKKGQKRK